MLLKELGVKLTKPTIHLLDWIMLALLEKTAAVQEVCELLKIKRSHLYSMTHHGTIPFLKVQGLLRFRRSSLEEWLRSQEVCSGST